MKSILVAVLTAAVVLATSACSPSGSGSTASSGASALGEAQCREVVQKSRELQGMPDDAFVEASEQVIRDCASKGRLQQEGYDCALGAGTIEEFQACGIDLS